MEGDVRIHGKSATIHFVTASAASTTLWRVKPHPRKDDPLAMADVRELAITELAVSPFHCQVNHTVPAVVFSTGFFLANFFHNFVDLLVPLFATTRPFSRDVQLLVTNSNAWLLDRYKPVIDGLTHHAIVDLDAEDRVHCFRRAIVGLRRHDTKEFSIDRGRPSLRDFAKFMRSAFAVKRQMAITSVAAEHPRLLLLARRNTRKFRNLDAIVAVAKEVGFEVVVTEGSDPDEFAKVVNTCDAMLGVHGAGLTNMVFLPEGAVVVQVVPLGNMLQWTRACFGEPAVEMGLRYLEYEIDVKESTLVELYPSDDAVFVDMNEISERGEWREVYLQKQDVALNITRFTSVLSQAMELLRQRALSINWSISH